LSLCQIVAPAASVALNKKEDPHRFITNDGKNIHSKFTFVIHSYKICHVWLLLS